MNSFKKDEDLNEGKEYIRPQNIKEFIGQSDSKDNLQTFISSAVKRNVAMDHALFVGPPGLGKTTLSQIVANELGVGFRSTSGPVITKAGDLAAILTNLNERDVLFIDEIHRLNSVVEEVLYPAMEDFQLDLIIGEGPSARSVRIDLPQFTLVGATTRSGLLTTPLRDRFGIHLRMKFYTISELEEILMNNSIKLEIKLMLDGANEIARRSRGTPRIAGRLLRRVRDFALVNGKNIIDKKEADIALFKLNIDQKGLDNIDRNYLKIIAVKYNGGPVGIETISASLSEQKDVVEEVIEPYLIQENFVDRTQRGRILTSEGWNYLGLPIPKNSFVYEDSKNNNN
jgi:Holliday junction DNA helicase RuvB